MFKKGSKIYSIVTGVCPKCHQESMYYHKNPYYLRHVINVKESCSKCGTQYRLEPSFFFGAMYVSYALGVAFAVAGFVVSYFAFDASIHAIFISIIATLTVFAPIILRWSRSIWVNIFIHYDKEIAEKVKQNKKEQV